MAKKAAFGTRLIITDPADSTQFLIHNVGDINGPSIEVTAIDATNHESPDGFAEFLPGMADAGEVTFDLFFDPDGTGHARLLEMVSERQLAAFILALPQPPAELLGGSDMSAWTASGSWNFEDGTALYDDLTPAGDDSISIALSGLIPEGQYTVTVTSGTAGSGETPIVIFDGVEIGEIPVEQLSTTFTFEASATAGNLEIVIPASSTETSARISTVSLVGVPLLTTERFEFAGLLTKVGLLMPVKDAMKATVAIKASGAPTYVSGAP